MGYIRERDIFMHENIQIHVQNCSALSQQTRAGGILNAATRSPMRRETSQEGLFIITKPVTLAINFFVSDYFTIKF
jgi:hypothetical protein